MTDFDLRWYATFALSVVLLGLLVSRIRLFTVAKINGKRVRYEYVIGYLMAAGGTFGSLANTWFACPAGWDDLSVMGGFSLVLWRTMERWTIDHLPDDVLTDAPTLTARAAHLMRRPRDRG